jgi:hypothetical protein
MRLAGYVRGDNPSATLMARFFGVRELLLGAMVLERMRFGTPETTMLRFNAMCDGLDSAVLLTSGPGESRIRELLTASTAAAASVAWTVLAQAAAD